MNFAKLSLFLATTLEHAPLEAVYIYFDTATYDEIVMDVSYTLEDQLGVVGGTMGLFTGFSILSGVKKYKNSRFIFCFL